MAITGQQLLSTEEFESLIGDHVRALRLGAGLDQLGLADLAGVSVGAVKNLEQGRGSTLGTVIKIVRALGRDDWLVALSPRVSVSPIDVIRSQRAPRRRVYRPRSKD